MDNELKLTEIIKLAKKVTNWKFEGGDKHKYIGKINCIKIELYTDNCGSECKKSDYFFKFSGCHIDVYRVWRNDYVLLGFCDNSKKVDEFYLSIYKKYSKDKELIKCDSLKIARSLIS